MPYECHAPWRETELPFLGNSTAQIAPAKVLPRRCCLARFPTHELRMVEIARCGANIAQARLAAVGNAAPARLLDVDVGAIGQHAHRVGKAHVVDLHHEAEHVTALAASEAVPQLRRRVDLARRRLLVVEGAAAPEIASALPHGNALSEKRDQIARFANLLDILVADAGHRIRLLRALAYHDVQSIRQRLARCPTFCQTRSGVITLT